jgi:demethylspheroidene O-methyltransferase
VLATSAPLIRSVLDRWSGWRDRLLASPAFRRHAAAFPLTRPVARRRARALFDLCAGFVYSQILLACVRLRVFEALAEGPQALPRLARRLGLAEDAAERLLKAAASLRLVRADRQGRYGLGPLGAALVGNPGLVAMIEHHVMLYEDLRDPVALLRGEATGSLNRYWAYAGLAQPGEAAAHAVDPYTSLMAASQPLVAAEILDAYPIDRHRHLLDIGGGDGSFITAAAERAPHLRLTLFDLPETAARARTRLSDAGLSGRTDAIGGDFFRDPLPQGADIVSLVRVIHDHDDGPALNLLRAVRAALPPGGTLLLAEPMAGVPGIETVGDAYFGFYLLAMGQGRARKPSELLRMLREAGFRRAQVRPTAMPLVTGLITATA